MTDGEIDALQIILNNEVIMRALKKVFDGAVTDSLPQIGAEDDSVVGQKYRAYESARQVVGYGFLNLESYRKSSTSGTGDVRHI